MTINHIFRNNIFSAFGRAKSKHLKLVESIVREGPPFLQHGTDAFAGVFVLVGFHNLFEVSCCIWRPALPPVFEKTLVQPRIDYLLTPIVEHSVYLVLSVFKARLIGEIKSRGRDDSDDGGHI